MLTINYLNNIDTITMIVKDFIDSSSNVDVMDIIVKGDDFIETLKLFKTVVNDCNSRSNEWKAYLFATFWDNTIYISRKKRNIHQVASYTINLPERS